MLRRFVTDERGGTAIEYALLGTIIAVALAATFTLVGENVAAVFGVGTGGPGDVMAAAAESLG